MFLENAHCYCAAKNQNQAMYALVDCNSFFCSVEKVFHPGLGGKPVVVLSSNDGCIVALTPEAKAAGLHRGDPIFKVCDIVERCNVHVFSTNMRLYAAMSDRVTDILRKNITHVEKYSIDESFCDLEGYDRYHTLTDFMRGVAEEIRLYTDIPVSVGIAPSKTLAKIGSKFAKQYEGYRGVCAIDTDAKRRKALSLFPLSDVWGIGRHTLEKLLYHGITTPLDFADRKESWVRSHLFLPGVQTWLELNGTPCIDTHEIRRNKNICTSRSFGNMIADIASLRSAIASFAASCANKLRGQGSVARTVTVFVMSNRFRDDLPQYANSASRSLSVATSDTMELTSAAMEALMSIFLPGIRYKKAGVALSDIVPAEPFEQYLFDEIKNRPQRKDLMRVMDDINCRHGVKTLHLAVEGVDKEAWHVRSEYRSPNYLTDIDEILTIKI